MDTLFLLATSLIVMPEVPLDIELNVHHIVEEVIERGHEANGDFKDENGKWVVMS